MSANEEADDNGLDVNALDDLRIRGIRPLVPSACLIEDVGGELAVYDAIRAARSSIGRAVRGEDNRLVVVTGPVSAHDPVAVMEYAKKLNALREQHSNELIIVMRVFLDEPAGGAGYWSGAMYDPTLDGTFQINQGFRQARQLLLDINRLGLPCGCIYLDAITPQFIADLVSWSFVSSLNAPSHLHRELASGLSTPVGFQAIGSGDLGVDGVVDAVCESAAPHAFLSVSKQGVAGIVETTGNRDCHVVLPPSDADVARACARLSESGFPERIMLECTDAPAVAAAATTVSKGGRRVFGMLLPSFLVGGAQPLKPNDPDRVYGQSVTQPCLDWGATANALEGLAAAVRQRRAASAPSPFRAPADASGHGGSAFLELNRIEATDNLRVSRIRPLMPAAVCMEEIEASSPVKHQVFEARCEVSGLLHGEDEKLLIVVGPCATHDSKAAMEYAARLVQLQKEVSGELLIIMQLNFESSASTFSSSRNRWKGLINDPKLDGTFQINQGFRQARQLLIDINQLGLPCGCEYLDTITPQYIADLVSWAYVGARTVASRAHRELASGLSTPVGFCRDDARDVILGSKGERVALGAVFASAAPHAFLSVSKQGVAGIVETTGNRDCHVVLPASGIRELLGPECTAIEALGLPARVMVACNAPVGERSASACRQAQKAAVADVASLVAEGHSSILGVLLNSFLLGGKQDLPSRADTPHTYGMSVTEPCLDWLDTEAAIRALADAAKKRRAASAAKKPRAA